MGNAHLSGCTFPSLGPPCQQRCAGFAILTFLTTQSFVQKGLKAALACSGFRRAGLVRGVCRIWLVVGSSHAVQSGTSCLLLGHELAVRDWSWFSCSSESVSLSFGDSGVYATFVRWYDACLLALITCICGHPGVPRKGKAPCHVFILQRPPPYKGVGL